MSASTESPTATTENLETAVNNMSLGAANQQDLDPLNTDSLLPLEPTYKLCMKYYKENVAKGLSIPYQDKMKLLALHKQVTSGKYKPESGEEPGFLDVVGNDRKQAWQALGDMTKEDAMKEFVKVLYKCSPSIKPYIIAYRVQQEEEAKQKKLEEDKKKQEEEEVQRQREAAASQQAQNQQEQQVRLVLNQQTEAQFRTYAQSQFPNDTAQQEVLIRQLQEQHFQQYVRQVYEQQMKQQQSAQMQGQPTAQTAGQSPAAPPQGMNSQPGALYAGAGSMEHPQHMANHSAALQAAGLPIPGATHNEQINGLSEPATHTDITLQEASMWTQKDTTAFKNAIKKESKMENHTDCIIKVGSGETVTIRVPTHENGNCLFWEFATDHYDIAFGVYFEWNNSPEDGIHLHVSDSSDDEEEETTSDDKEKGGGEARKPRGPPIDEIIPIYRRDSHEEVYCGSHVYPGRGVYLLKFDNSYSLWRSKTLYYRVYYSR